MANASSKIATFPGADSNGDIRGLAEQLQDAVREARIRQQVAEEEKDRLLGKIAQMESQLEQARGSGSEYMSDPADSELKAKIEATEKQKADALRQRDLSVRLTQDLQKQIKELEASNHDLDHQLASIRQARDNAAAQVSELREKIVEKDDEMANIVYDRDIALKSAEKSVKEIDDLRKQLQAGGGLNESDAKKIEELTAELEAQRGVNAKLTEEAGHAAKAQEALNEKEAEMEALRNELAEAQSKAPDTEALEKIQQDFDKAKMAQEAAQELLMKQLSEAQARGEGSELMQQEFEAAKNVLMGEIEALRKEIEEARSAGNPAIEGELEILKNQLLESRNDIQAVMLERDALRARSEEGNMDMDAQLSDQLAEITNLKRELEAAAPKLSEYHEVKMLSEQQRLDVIEIGAKLDNAQREIRQLSANLAEIRLAAKMAGVSVGGTKK